MSRTVKTEWSAPDGWHVGRRLERKARPAGRMRAILEAEREAHGEDEELLEEWEAHRAYEDELAQWEATLPDFDETWCGCYCRRCLLHDDCGGCMAPGGHSE